MTVYTGTNNRRYTIDTEPFASGGEGMLYRVRGAGTLVAKIFKSGKNTEMRRRKLKAIINATAGNKENDWVIWPIDILYDGGKFAGYVMPMLEGGEALNVMYSDKYALTLKEKIQIAKRLCLAVNSVHNMDQVIGDLNPDNIMVNPNNLSLRLVDSDSYHIHDERRTYRCEVGRGEYFPKELQEKFSNGAVPATAPLPTFTKETDNFALSVHIFALLMNGTHPYSCAINQELNIERLSKRMPSIARPQPVEGIRDGFFPFVDRREGLTTPVFAPDYNTCTSQVRELFFRAFKKGDEDPLQRPRAIEWYNALQKMENSLIVCRRERTHMYPSGLSECPWCKLEAREKAFAGGLSTSGSLTVNHEPKTETQPIQSAKRQSTQSVQVQGNNNSIPSQKTIGVIEGLFLALSGVYSSLCAFLVLFISVYFELVYSSVKIDMVIWAGALLVIIWYSAQNASPSNSSRGDTLSSIWFCMSMNMFNIAVTYRSAACMVNENAGWWLIAPFVTLCVAILVAVLTEDRISDDGVEIVRGVSVGGIIAVGVIGFFDTMSFDFDQPSAGYHIAIATVGIVCLVAVVASIRTSETKRK